MNSVQYSVNEIYKSPKSEIITNNLSLFEFGKQKLINVAKKTFTPLLSLGIGVATIPLNVIIHEYGHALAGKFFDENCNPIMHWNGPYFMGSSVSFGGCNLSGYSDLAIGLGGPLAETIAILAVLRFSKSKYTPIALLPHIAHITLLSLQPILFGGGDYAQILEVGPIPYSIAVAASLVPLALSTLSRIRQIQEVVKISLDCFFVENTGHEKVCDQKLEKHIKNLHKSLQQILQEPVISLRPLKQSPNAQEPLEPLSYKEPQENNILQAKDTMTFPDPDGAIYEGDFVDGLRRGKGKYIFLDGAIYEGDFVGGLFQGKGKYIFTDGAIYEGDFVGGLRTGKGKYIWRSGAIYEGNFVNGSCTGKGKMIFLDGENYEGNFVNGLRSGRGKYIWRNGDTYEGNFVNGSCTGKGKYTFSDGAIYEGDFVDGWVQGKSKYTFFFRQVIWRLLGAPTSKRFLGRQ